MPPGAEKLDFRGIWAWDDNTAMVMASGPGDASRIYKTVDGCSSWKLLFTNPDKDGFWDAMVFSGNRQDGGIILGDPVNGRFVVDHLLASGKLFQASVELPTATPESKGAFAASNSSLAICREFTSDCAWFGAGGGLVYMLRERRVMPVHPEPHTMYHIYETYWESVKTPIAGGNDSSGVFSVAFRDPDHGMAVGGDYTKPNESAGTAAWSADGGKIWTGAAKPPHGYRSAVAWDPEARAWIAAGANGSDISYDDGKKWVSLDDGNWNALSLPWVVGPGGRIAKLDPGKLPK
jgi:photosystem II stability/assembly factor-like uncharacterized protein